MLLLPDALNTDPTEASEESLGSWLHRLTHINGLQSIAQVLKLVGISPILTEMPRQLDVAVRRLAEATGADPHLLHSLHMVKMLETTDKGSMRAANNWLLRTPPLGTVRDRYPGLRHMICPQCVGLSEIVHWKRSWRLSWNTSCPIHRRILLDACPACEEPFLMHLRGENSLSNCVGCGLRVADMPIGPPSDYEAYIDFPDDSEPGALTVEPLDGARWVGGVRKLVTLIEEPQRAARLLKGSMPDVFKIILAAIACQERCSFDAWEVGLREGGIRIVEWLRDPWPDRLGSLLDEVGINWRHIPCLHDPTEHWVNLGLQAWSDSSRKPLGA